MKFRVVCRKLYDYVRYDLKEIAFPSSLPDPPHIKKRPKLTWYERWCILKEATRLYGASWVWDIGPDLRPNDYKKAAEDEERQSSNASPNSRSDKKGKVSSEPSVLEDLAVAARGGAETLKPALRRIYMARASTYIDAMKNFVETYQEGLKDQLQEKANGGEGGGGISSNSSSRRRLMVEKVVVVISSNSSSMSRLMGHQSHRHHDIVVVFCWS